MKTFRQFPVSQQGKPDLRYSVTREWCGQPEPRFVARFCGDWIGHDISYPGAVLLAVGHNCRRMGAPVIVEKAARRAIAKATQP